MANIDQTTETKKLKIRADVTTQVEKEVDSPYFCKHHPTYCKVTDNYVLRVAVLYNDSCSIDYCTDGTCSGVVAMSAPCTESEFNAAFQTALNKIDHIRAELMAVLQKIVVFIDNEGPAAREWQAITEVTEQAKAAITKATGGTNS